MPADAKETVNKNVKGLCWRNPSYYRNKRIAFPLTEIASEIYRVGPHLFFSFVLCKMRIPANGIPQKRKEKTGEPKSPPRKQLRSLKRTRY
jgi:hypothetical protein